ncbi:tricarballylate dehydrogenase [Planktotalea frisia]|uniref:Fumarate reductase flavoprotein subunit n=2 Tax=Planktotalea frisia TaxID=696762 RepID=A0A1L9NWQ3_9RHOB|nr:FAD-dependent tricarballylate dehydrogenase TcuA [Planktotalea frisia]OJI93735.1 fumarate reductase flavoprotein subunit precursor [Planktotalea frisia]PZX28841.1 tricarballylate dehydrogenase [Planktotalea frisia]
MSDTGSPIWDVIIVGSGNAALSAGIAACEKGASVLMIEKADQHMSGGNTKYTAGAMRFAYETSDALLPLLAHPEDPRVPRADFGSYTQEKFKSDLLGFNDGKPLTPEQDILVSQSYETMHWLAGHGVTYEPIWARQSFEKDGKIIFWGGLTLAAENEGVGLFDMELAAFERLGGQIRYNTEFADLVVQDGTVCGVTLADGSTLSSASVILACGGFESNEQMRIELIGPEWEHAKVRGTPHNTGDGLKAAWAIGAQKYGRYDGCHATPMDYFMKNYGNLDIPHGERKNYRKISYFLGVMLNEEGQRFVDEGIEFRNYTYAQFGRAVLQQPGQRAWQIYDAKVFDILYGEYRFHDAHFEEADDLATLLGKCDGLDADAALATLAEYNASVAQEIVFDPTIKDGKSAKSGDLAKSNWAQTLDKGPFRAFPVTGGITFTYGGLKVSEKGQVLNEDGAAIEGLFACGEIVGGVFLNGYPGGSGLTSGAVFGRLAGASAASE